MDNIKDRCTEIQVVRTTNSGFMWAFEYRSGKLTSGKKSLIVIEENLKRYLSRDQQVQLYRPNRADLVAVYVHEWNRWCRGYVYFKKQDSKGISFRIFCLDYGLFFYVEEKYLKPLPPFASLSTLPPQALKIALYGLSPTFLSISLVSEPELKKSPNWNPKDVNFIDKILKRSVFSTVYFEEKCESDGFRFGILYVKDKDNVYVTLQDLLITQAQAVICKNFEREIPAIVRMFKRSGDNLTVENGIVISDTFESFEHENISEERNTTSTREKAANPVAMEVTPVRKVVDNLPQRSPSEPIRRGRGRGLLLGTRPVNSTGSVRSPNKTLVASPASSDDTVNSGPQKEITDRYEYFESRLNPSVRSDSSTDTHIDYESMKTDHRACRRNSNDSSVNTPPKIQSLPQDCESETSFNSDIERGILKPFSGESEAESHDEQPMGASSKPIETGGFVIERGRLTDVCKQFTNHLICPKPVRLSPTSKQRFTSDDVRTDPKTSNLNDSCKSNEKPCSSDNKHLPASTFETKKQLPVDRFSSAGNSATNIDGSETSPVTTSTRSRSVNSTQYLEQSDCDTTKLSPLNCSTPSSEMSFRRMNAKFTSNSTQKVEQPSTEPSVPERFRRFDVGFPASQRSKAEPAVVAERSEVHSQRPNTVNSPQEMAQSVRRSENSPVTCDLPSEVPNDDRFSNGARNVTPSSSKSESCSSGSTVCSPNAESLVSSSSKDDRFSNGVKTFSPNISKTGTSSPISVSRSRNAMQSVPSRSLTEQPHVKTNLARGRGRGVKLSLSPFQQNTQLRPKQPFTASNAANHNYFRHNQEVETSYDDDLLDPIKVIGNAGNCCFKPRYKIFDIINGELQEKLRQLGVRDSIVCQQYMVPAMLSRKNVTLVEGAGAGKSVACIIALISMLSDTEFYKSYAQLPVGPGPKAIILSPHSSRCELLFTQCSHFVKKKFDSTCENSELKVEVAYGCGKKMEQDKREELTKGYDIVICTPNCLLRLLEVEEMFNLKRLCHIVYDEAHILFNEYWSEITEIGKKIFRRGIGSLTLPQRIIISNNWIPDFRRFVENDVAKQQGVALLSSYLEAGAFCRIKGLMEYVNDTKKKNNHLIDYICNKASTKSMVIVFNEDFELMEFEEILRKEYTRKIYTATKQDYMLSEISDDWKYDNGRKNCPVMLCTDYTLPDLKIYDSDLLIHYSVPSGRKEFSRRFSVLLNRMSTPSNYCPDGSKPPAETQTEKPEVLFYLNSTNSLQFPTVINFMEKLGGSVPSGVRVMLKKLKLIKEQNKGNVDVCLGLKMFGKCHNETECSQRHVFTLTKDAPAADIPHEGLVKIHILQVYSASHFCGRILERKDESSKWVSIKSISHPYTIEMKMSQFFADPSNRNLHLCKEIGEIAAIKVNNDVYKRVRVMKINDEKSKTVAIRYLEDGREDVIKASMLLELPNELASITPSAVDIFLGNSLPIDKDVTWGDIITRKVKDDIRTHMKNPNSFFIGKIKLVAGRNVWMHPLECKVLYKSIGTYVSEYSVNKELLKEGMSVSNPAHLTNLGELFTACGLPTSIDLQSHSSLDISNGPANKCLNKPVSCEPTDEKSEDTSPAQEVETVPSESTTTVEVNAQNVSSSNDEESEWVLGNGESENVKPVAENQTTNANELVPLAMMCDRAGSICSNSDSDEFEVNFGPEDIELLRKQLGIEITLAQPAIKATEKTVKPKVIWRQDINWLWLKIDVNCDDYVFRHTSSTIYFRAVLSTTVYEFNETLYAKIKEKTVEHKKSSVHILVKLEKYLKPNKWKRLLKGTEVQNWLKIDTEYTDEDYVNSGEIYWPTRAYENPAMEEITEKITIPPGMIMPEGWDEEDYLSESDYNDHCEFSD